MKLMRTLGVALSIALVPSVVLAASLYNPIGTNDLSAFLAKILHLVVQIVFPIIVLFIVYIGFLFVSSQGNPEKLKEAKEYFFWALVGALIVLGAEALSLAIKATVDQL
jgi:hypothetical protein